MIPTELRYLESHEWARRQEPDTITIGLTAHAVEQLGDIVYLDLPQVGTTIEKGSTLCDLESVKAASDIYAPVSGKIIAVNESLPDNLDLFKTDPYGDAWIARIQASDPKEFDTLLDAAAYEASIRES